MKAQRHCCYIVQDHVIWCALGNISGLLGCFVYLDYPKQSTDWSQKILYSSDFTVSEMSLLGTALKKAPQPRLQGPPLFHVHDSRFCDHFKDTWINIIKDTELSVYSATFGDAISWERVGQLDEARTDHGHDWRRIYCQSDGGRRPFLEWVQELLNRQAEEDEEEID